MNNQPINQEDASRVLEMLAQDDQSSLFSDHGLSAFDLDMMELADDGAPQPRIWRAAR